MKIGSILDLSHKLNLISFNTSHGPKSTFHYPLHSTADQFDPPNVLITLNIPFPLKDGDHPGFPPLI